MPGKSEISIVKNLFMAEQNRVDEQLRKWEAANPKPTVFSASYWDNRLGILEQIKMAFKDATDFRERESLERVDKEILRAAKEITPDFLNRLVWGFIRVGNLIADKVLEWAKIEQPLVQRSEPMPQWYPNGLSKKEQERKLEHYQDLNETLRNMNLPVKADGYAATRIAYDEPSLKLSNDVKIGYQQAKLETYVERAQGTGRYYPTGYDLTTYRGLMPERDEVAGVNVRDLDRRMREVPWRTDFSMGGVAARKDPTENARLLDTVKGIFTDLNRLLASGDPGARKIHDQLAVNYFLDTPNEVLVPNMEEIKKQFEHKIHVDLSPASLYPMDPTEAMQLLNRRSVNIAQDSGGHGETWLGIDPTQKDARGFYQIRPVEGGERFILRSALAQAQVRSFPDFRTDAEAIQALQKGESVKAELLQNGQSVQRYIHADPARGKMGTDWIKSENEGLFRRDEQLVSSLDQYLSRQHGTYVAPTLVSQQETPKQSAQTAQQPLFWEPEETRKLQINPVNLASLEQQLTGMGVRPGVAGEVLEAVAKTGQGDLNYPYIQEYGQNKEEAQIRFKRDAELDWVYLQGFDAKVSFGNGMPDVYQRYYYNAEDPINNYSLNEAYWMATGNSVSRTVGSDGQEKEVWRGLAFDQPKTPKGNHQITSIPFDLEKAVLEYPHKNELEKHLAPGYTIDSIIARARKGEPAQFPIVRDGTTELLSLKVSPKESTISILRVGEVSKDNKVHQHPVVSQGNAMNREVADEPPSRSAARSLS